MHRNAVDTVNAIYTEWSGNAVDMNAFMQWMQLI